MMHNGNGLKDPQPALAASSGREPDRSSAQVAPLPSSFGIPRQDDFHVGKVLGDASQIVKAPREEEESYIPVALARSHLTKVVEDMHAMKEEQTAKMTQIMERYKAIEAETKSYYENYIRELKRKATDKFRAEQSRYSALQEDSKTQQELAAEKLRELQEASDRRQQQHEDEREHWREDLETSLLSHEEELTLFHETMQRRLRLVLHDQSHSMSESHCKQVDVLRMGWEDTRAETLRMLERARATQQRITTSESQYKEQIRRLKRDFAVELETFKCVSTAVNRVVDMEEQTRRRRRSKELRNEIQRLSEQITESVGREKELESQLQRVTTQYEEMEQRAVKQTMEVFLRTVELTPPEDRLESKSGSDEQAKEEEEEEEHKQTKVERKGSRNEADGPMPETREGETQTNTLKEEAVDSPAQATVEMCDAAVETEEAESKPEPVVVEGQAEVRHTTEPADRIDDHKAELSRLKNEYRAAKAAVQQRLDGKTNAKTRIKQWLADFQKEHAREPTIEEKTQVKDLYLTFKQSEDAYNVAKDGAAKAKALYHARLMEAEALSGTSTLDLALNSARRSEEEASRPGTAVFSGASGSRPMSREATEALVNVAALEREINDLRGELTKAQETQWQADAAAKEVAAEAQRAIAEAKQSADRLVRAAEHKAKDGEMESVVGAASTEESRAGAKDSLREDREEEEKKMMERKAQEADALRHHQQTMELYAREAKALEQTQSELKATIVSLRDEINQRTAEKEALEMHTERLRLHIELVEEGEGLADDGSDAKSTSRRNLEGEVEDQEELEEAANDEGDEAEEKHSHDEDEEADSKASSSALSPLKSPMPLSDTEKADAAREAQLMASIHESIEAGKAQWNRGDKAKCFQIYVKTCEKCIESLREMKAPPVGRREEVAGFKGALQEAGRLPPAKGSMVLRRQLDACLAACETRIKERDGKEAAAAMAALAAAQSPAKSASTPSPQRKAQQHKKSIASSTVTDATDDKAGNAMAATTPVGGTRALEELKQKLKATETKAKADRVRITQLEASLSKAETQLLSVSASGNGSGGGANTVMLERKLADAEKKHAKVLEEAEKVMKRDMAAISQQLSASQTKSQALQEQVDKLTKELTVVGGRATQLTKIEEEVTALRVKAAQVDSLSQELTTRQSELVKLEVSYKEEQALRKKYYNQIEDMKGKIRVYARCRPMSSSENERGCDTSVRFLDEFSLELKTSHGPKTFAYDQVFTPASTQDQVFEDTKNLLQSALDGYNVCIFAYGQTGSGKTFTMTGSEAMPGLSPRAIHHLFRLADESSGNHSITFQAFMLELYNDALIDLFYLVDGGAADHGPKLDIKKNDRGMVFVSNITQKSCSSAQQTLKLFDAANKKRQVGATKMNAESSRSHSVFSLVIENYNKTTKTTSIGKLSLVDLAGSERAGKTGATNDRLKEAQAINKSLSALGDVIAALSSGEKFIPYRNNKLTQLMQDSLGGNAKTLMFVNISPADYNQEETQTSLQYASRVKLITNNANKTSESETVNKLKAIIKQLRAGKADVDVEGLDV